MGLSRKYRSARARYTRFSRKLASGMKYLSLSRYSRTPARREHFWTMFSRSFLIVITYLLLCCTAIDVLRQSFKSGQFWNSIIVIVCVAIIATWTIGLSLVRRVDVNRWLQAIPRHHQLSRSDVGAKMMDRIAAQRHWCAHLFNTQLDFSEIEHPGLQNPMQKHSNFGADSGVETPYWEFMDTIASYLEDNFAVVVPELTIPKQSTLRDYMERAVSEKVLDTTNIEPHIERFLELYEKGRYSGGSLLYSELIELMNSLVRIVEEIQYPEVNAGDNRSTSSSFPTPYHTTTYPGYSLPTMSPYESSYLSPTHLHPASTHPPTAQNASAPTQNDNHMRPEMAPASPFREHSSSVSTGSSSLESVRVYRTRESMASARTGDSQLSVISHASVLSPFARLRRTSRH